MVCTYPVGAMSIWYKGDEVPGITYFSEKLKSEIFFQHLQTFSRKVQKMCKDSFNILVLYHGQIFMLHH